MAENTKRTSFTREGGASVIRDPYIPFLLPKSWVNWRVHV